MKLNFSTEAFILPASVLSHLSGAQDAWIRILLWLASDPTLAQKPKQLAKLADCDQKNVKAALQYWTEKGVLCSTEEAIPVMSQAVSAPTEPQKEASAKPIRRADMLPQYSSTELAEVLEHRENVRILVDEAQRILGKMFHPAEINLLIGLTDYLEMSDECVLMLLAHCKKIGKTNMRSIEKYAFDLSDKGITEAADLEEEFRTLETLHGFEGDVRAMFGLKSRALSAKESKMLRAWISYGYTADIVRRAYDITVNSIGEASLPYANSILERWHTEGLTTAEQIDRSLQQEQAQKDSPKAALGNSFNTDDFFEAAMRRGLSDNIKH